MSAYVEDELVTRFLASREQDNEKIADDSAMMEAQRQDDEITTQGMAEDAVVKVQEPIPDPQLPDDAGLPEGLPKEGTPEYETPSKEETTWDAVSRVAKDVLTNAPENITVGGVTALKNSVDAVAPGWLAESDKMLTTLGMGDYVEATNTYFNDTIRNADTSDKVVQEMSQFMLPFGVYMKQLGALSSMGTVSRAFAADAAASFFNIDPHIERLSKVAHEMGLESDLIAWLGSDGGTDAENRFKNVIENQALGAAVGVTFYTAAKTMKGVYTTAKKMKAQYDEVGADKFLGPVIATGAVATGSEEAEAGGFAEDIVSAIRTRNKRLEESLGEEAAPEKQEMPEDPRSDVDIIGTLPDDIYMEWDQTTPIKQWLWVKYPDMLQSAKNGSA